VAVAALFTVVGASMKATGSEGVNHTLTADLVGDRGGYGGWTHRARRAGWRDVLTAIAAS
jgi:hypothetical protein